MKVIEGLSLVMRLRILEPCYIRGIEALEGDVWLVARAEALTLLNNDRAARIKSEDDPLELPTHDLYSEGPNDPAPRLVSRVPENERKPRPGISMAKNLTVFLAGSEMLAADNS